jgi:hypothetical protein
MLIRIAMMLAMALILEISTENEEETFSKSTTALTFNSKHENRANLARGRRGELKVQWSERVDNSGASFASQCVSIWLCFLARLMDGWEFPLTID